MKQQEEEEEEEEEEEVEVVGWRHACSQRAILCRLCGAVTASPLPCHSSSLIHQHSIQICNSFTTSGIKKQNIDHYLNLHELNFETILMPSQDQLITVILMTISLGSPGSGNPRLTDDMVYNYSLCLVLLIINFTLIT